jgi:hypothetical protein
MLSAEDRSIRYILRRRPAHQVVLFPLNIRTIRPRKGWRWARILAKNSKFLGEQNEKQQNKQNENLDVLLTLFYRTNQERGFLCAVQSIATHPSQRNGLSTTRNKGEGRQKKETSDDSVAVESVVRVGCVLTCIRTCGFTF